MKKNNVIIGIIIVILIVILSVILFKKTNKNEDTVTKNVEYVQLEKLPKEYTMEMAIKDDCFVIPNDSNKIYNKERLDLFLENVNNYQEDMIRIVNFTIEGDLLIKDIQYRLDYFRVSEDNTRDRYISEEYKIIDTNRYNTKDYKLVVEEIPSYDEDYISLFLVKQGTEKSSELYNPEDKIWMYSYNENSEIQN